MAGAYEGVGSAMNRNKGGNIISLVLALSLFFGMTVSASNWGKSQQERQLSSLKVGEFEWSEELEAGNPGIDRRKGRRF